MKLSKTSYLILTIGFFIIAFASLGIARSQQAEERNQLTEKLSLVEPRLNGLQLELLSSQYEELEESLSQTVSQLDTAKAMLSQPTKSITASNTLFNIAEHYGVEVTELSSSGLTNGELEGITCSVLTLTVRVTGEISELINFITKLNGEFMTGVVKSVDISVSENVTVEKSSANIQLSIYTYEGD